MLIRSICIDRESTKRNERGCRLSNVGATLTHGSRRAPLIVIVSRQTAFFSFCSAGVAQIKFRRMKRMERTIPIFHPLRRNNAQRKVLGRSKCDRFARMNDGSNPDGRLRRMIYACTSAATRTPFVRASVSRKLSRCPSRYIPSKHSTPFLSSLSSHCSVLDSAQNAAKQIEGNSFR